jgi:hypothetical protein
MPRLGAQGYATQIQALPSLEAAAPMEDKKKRMYRF